MRFSLDYRRYEHNVIIGYDTRHIGGLVAAWESLLVLLLISVAHRRAQ